MSNLFKTVFYTVAMLSFSTSGYGAWGRVSSAPAAPTTGSAPATGSTGTVYRAVSPIGVSPGVALPVSVAPTSIATAVVCCTSASGATNSNASCNAANTTPTVSSIVSLSGGSLTATSKSRCLAVGSCNWNTTCDVVATSTPKPTPTATPRSIGVMVPTALPISTFPVSVAPSVGTTFPFMVPLSVPKTSFSAATASVATANTATAVANNGTASAATATNTGTAAGAATNGTATGAAINSAGTATGAAGGTNTTGASSVAAMAAQASNTQQTLISTYNPTSAPSTTTASAAVTVDVSGQGCCVNYDFNYPNKEKADDCSALNKKLISEYGTSFNSVEPYWGKSKDRCNQFMDVTDRIRACAWSEHCTRY